MSPYPVPLPECGIGLDREEPEDFGMPYGNIGTAAMEIVDALRWQKIVQDMQDRFFQRWHRPTLGSPPTQEPPSGADLATFLAQAGGFVGRCPTCGMAGSGCS